MSWNIVLKMSFGDCLNIFSRSQYGSTQRGVLKCGCMQMVKNNFFHLPLHLQKRTRNLYESISMYSKSYVQSEKVHGQPVETKGKKKKKKRQTDSQLVKMAFISNEYKEWLEQTKKKRKTYADVYMDPYCSLCRSHHGWSQPKVLTIHLQGFNLFLPADIDVHSSCFFINFTVLHKYNEKNGCRKGDRHICL